MQWIAYGFHFNGQKSHSTMLKMPFAMRYSHSEICTSKTKARISMKLEQLAQLDAIERHKTLSAAANALHTTQPTLSRSMRSLEADLGQPLFIRTKNRAALNDAGRIAVDHARRILAEERRMREALAELSKRQRTISVASVAPAPIWRLGEIAAKRFPTSIIDPELVGDKEAQRRLANGECDLAIARRPAQLPTLTCAPVMTEDLCLSVPAGHKLSEKPSVAFSDLDGEPFLVFEQIGVWMEVCKRMLPHSQIIVQKDRIVFMQLSRVTSLCCFTTQAAEIEGGNPERCTVPISDAAAHATFFLCMRHDAPTSVRKLFDEAARSFDHGKQTSLQR